MQWFSISSGEMIELMILSVDGISGQSDPNQDNDICL